MLKLYKIQKAIKFATKTHEVYQKQKRKGKDIAYITHPLTVGLILAHAGANDDVICAGILHDTIEDSTEEKKVSFEMIKDRFGEEVANLVLAVTETDKSLPWEERKMIAKEHIANFSNDAVLVKSADILANTKELSEDYAKDGEQIFMRFNAPKEKLLKNYLETITVLIEKWPDNPLAQELRFVSSELGRMTGDSFMSENPTKIIEKLNEWASDLTLDQIQKLSEEEILEYVMERPDHPGQYGFMLQMQYFNSEKEFSATMHALMARLGKIENLKEKMQN